MSAQEPQLIVALDVHTLEEAKMFIDKLAPAVDIFKVGNQLFTACGPAAVRFILARGKKVFLDLKYHDIPNTVSSAVQTAVGLGVALQSASKAKEEQSIFMLTIHTQGGRKMMESALAAARQKAAELGVCPPLIVGVTVLTSEEKKYDLEKDVLQKARLAKESGLDGVVASVEEAGLIRKEFGDDFIIVTPGIRPKDKEAADQKRTGTPQDAVKAGSNFLVVGRPIIESKDPLKTAQSILNEIRG